MNDIISGDTKVTIEGGTIGKDVFGSGYRTIVGGNVGTTIEDATIKGSVYGAGEVLTLVGTDRYGLPLAGYGNLTVNIKSSNITGSVYGGGKISYADYPTSRVGIMNYADIKVVMYSGTVGGSIVGGSQLVDVSSLSSDGGMTVIPRRMFISHYSAAP